MKKLFKCTVCGYIHEGENPPAACPKCGVGPDKFNLLDEETTNKIYRADKTNDYHAKMISLANKMVKICEKGIEDNLDPGCLSTFEKAKNEAWVIKQRSKAELEKHMNAKKW
ncbi:MAG: rubredoxin-like domain-containing protein [Clostridium sp.]